MSLKYGFLSGNLLKILACVFMFIDHLGVIIFPDVYMLRAVGRLAMPIFAWMLAEGCYYTKNKLNHFILIFGLGLITSIVYSVLYDILYGDILITFSLSCLLIYSIDALKMGVVQKNKKKATLSIFALISVLALSIYLCFFSGIIIDYGFAGVLLPVTVRLYDFYLPSVNKLKRENNPPINLLLFVLCLVIIAITSSQRQFLSLLSVIFILLYNGERGKGNLKYFFYLFYPLHILFLAGINFLIHPDQFTALFL